MMDLPQTLTAEHLTRTPGQNPYQFPRESLARRADTTFVSLQFHWTFCEWFLLRLFLFWWRDKFDPHRDTEPAIWVAGMEALGTAVCLQDQQFVWMFQLFV